MEHFLQHQIKILVAASMLNLLAKTLEGSMDVTDKQTTDNDFNVKLLHRKLNKKSGIVADEMDAIHNGVFSGKSPKGI